MVADTTAPSGQPPPGASSDAAQEAEGHSAMSPISATTLQQIASEAHERHSSLNPVFVGACAFGILLLLLWITTRFNKDR
jgi:hypothetical protein